MLMDSRFQSSTPACRRWSRAPVFSICLLLIKQCSSFGIARSSFRRNLPYAQQPLHGIQSMSALSAIRDSPFLKDAALDEKVQKVVTDAQGKEITINVVVRVVTSGLKAFQVSPKGRGLFEDGKFVEHQEPYMILPLGLQGLVTKVYDVDEVSANFPIQVKFVPGEHVGEVDTPVPFIMHFLPTEIEVV